MPARQPPHAAPKPNRLAAQTSPYLLQHRFNPVDWYPWGDEAFAEARKRDVPIFLSVGYSTCYWCHVMERESFENQTIARQMNAGFICIKVDREERPDVDDVYMAAVQAFTHRGGWPMSVFLEPKTLKPFWAGTYFPAEPKFAGTPTFPQVLDSISTAWKDHRADVLAQANELADAVRERIAGAGAGEAKPVRIGEAQVTQAASQLLKLFDPIHGGFGPAPKFPQPVFLDFLLTVYRAAGDEDTHKAIETALDKTLTEMALGGIFDQVGGGFHRYSTDDKWLVPHFEKMLYDNGQLAETYARCATTLAAAAKVVPNLLYARTARRICDYILREMVSPQGAFFSAQDAEVNHREGQNYLWTKQQIADALHKQPDDAQWLISIFGLDKGPNFRDPHHPDEPPSNVLFLRASEKIDDAVAPRLNRLNAILYEARKKRDQPSTDDKVLAGWNGLMIAGLAVTGANLKEPRFIEAARRAADFILASMRAPDGSLLRSFAKGKAAVPAFLEDYAFLAHGLIELHLSGTDSSGKYLHAAQDLLTRAEKLFGDGHGGFYDTLTDQPDLFVRARSIHDGAVPSGSSVMINNYLDLAVITGDPAFRAKAAAGLAAVSGSIASQPTATANSTRALLRLLALDRAALDKALAGAAPAGSPTVREGSGPDPVEIHAAVESATVAPGEPAAFKLRIHIADGYHLTAAEERGGGPGLVPFRVHIINGSGVTIYADYPKGQPYGDKGDLLIYRGQFDLPIVLERQGDWKGTPLIAVTYQPCTDEACLAARTVELDVSIDRK